MRWPLLAACSILAGISFAAADDPGEAARLNEKANALYRAGRLEEALALYGEAVAADPDSPALRYNLGNALFRLQRLDEASGEFGAAAEEIDRPRTADVRADALYNQGRTLLEQQDYEGAIQALREVLLRTPDAEDARRNLEVALARLVEQQQQEQQDQEGDDDPDSQEQDDPQPSPSDENDPSDDPQEGESPEESDSDSPEDASPQEPADGAPPEDSGEQDPSSRPEPGDEKELGEEEARRLLEALAQDERSELKESLERRPRRKGKPERDW